MANFLSHALLLCCSLAIVSSVLALPWSSSNSAAAAAKLRKSLTSLNQQQKDLVTELLTEAVLAQVREYLDINGKPSEFMQKELEKLDINSEDDWSAEALRRASEAVLESRHVSKDQYNTAVVEPCKQVVSKLEGPVTKYFYSGDEELLYAVKYYQLCKTIVEAKYIENDVVDPVDDE